MNFNKLGMAYTGKHLGVQVSENGEMEELKIPGLIEPELVAATLKYVDGRRSVVVTGKFYKEQHVATVCGNESTYKIADFEEVLEVPINAKDPVPKVTLITSKDECGQVSDGLLRVEWEVADVNIPVTIKDCAEG